MNNEIWKDIKDYEGKYQISNYGRVKSVYRKVNHRYRGEEKTRTIYEKILKKSN